MDFSKCSTVFANGFMRQYLDRHDEKVEQRQPPVYRTGTLGVWVEIQKDRKWKSQRSLLTRSYLHKEVWPRAVSSIGVGMGRQDARTQHPSATWTTVISLSSPTSQDLHPPHLLKPGFPNPYWHDFLYFTLHTGWLSLLWHSLLKFFTSALF